MNIFKILSSGDGSIKEPNVSAFLGYLLDPNKEHGLKDFLLKTVLERLTENNTITSLMVNENIVNLTNDSDFKIDVELEKTVTIKSGKKKDIDIVINIFKDTELIFILCIENKINAGSATKNQLNEQLEGIQKEGVDINKIGFIYLTPKNCPKCKEEYENFKNSNNNIPAKHLSWNEDIYNLLVEMLDKESKGMIEPIFDYSKYTIKAFMNFIKTDFQSLKDEKSNINKIRYSNIEDYIASKQKSKSDEQKSFLRKLIKGIEDECQNSLEFTYAESKINVKKSEGNVLVYITTRKKDIKLSFYKLYDFMKENNSFPKDDLKVVRNEKEGNAILYISNNDFDFKQYIPYFEQAFKRQEK